MTSSDDVERQRASCLPSEKLAAEGDNEEAQRDADSSPESPRNGSEETNGVNREVEVNEPKPEVSDDARRSPEAASPSRDDDRALTGQDGDSESRPNDVEARVDDEDRLPVERSGSGDVGFESKRKRTKRDEPPVATTAVTSSPPPTTTTGAPYSDACGDATPLNFGESHVSRLQSFVDSVSSVAPVVDAWTRVHPQTPHHPPNFRAQSRGVVAASRTAPSVSPPQLLNLRSIPATPLGSIDRRPRDFRSDMVAEEPLDLSVRASNRTNDGVPEFRTSSTAAAVGGEDSAATAAAAAVLAAAYGAYLPILSSRDQWIAQWAMMATASLQSSASLFGLNAVDAGCQPGATAAADWRMASSPGRPSNRKRSAVASQQQKSSGSPASAGCDGTSSAGSVLSAEDRVDAQHRTPNGGGPYYGRRSDALSRVADGGDAWRNDCAPAHRDRVAALSAIESFVENSFGVGGFGSAVSGSGRILPAPLHVDVSQSALVSPPPQRRKRHLQGVAAAGAEWVATGSDEENAGGRDHVTPEAAVGSHKKPRHAHRSPDVCRPANRKSPSDGPPRPAINGQPAGKVAESGNETGSRIVAGPSEYVQYQEQSNEYPLESLEKFVNVASGMLAPSDYRMMPAATSVALSRGICDVIMTSRPPRSVDRQHQRLPESSSAAALPSSNDYGESAAAAAPAESDHVTSGDTPGERARSACHASRDRDVLRASRDVAPLSRSFTSPTSSLVCCNY